MYITIPTPIKMAALCAFAGLAFFITENAFAPPYSFVSQCMAQANSSSDALKAPSDVKLPPKTAQKSKSGLASRVIKPGIGKKRPSATSVVEVHYTGWTTDGKMFDSSVARGKTAQFPLNRVISGWTEGLQLMVEGEKRRLWIPESLAYKGAEGPPKGMLVFDVELIKIVQP